MGSGVTRSGTDTDTTPGSAGANTRVAAWHPWTQEEVGGFQEWAPMGAGAQRPGKQDREGRGTAPGTMEEGT